MKPDRFPVVDERPLLRPERRWVFGAWRDPAQLPVRPPGCVYVFAVDGKHTPCPDLGHVSGTESEVVNATWVSVVNVRYQRITATTWVPSTDPSVDFVVRAVFGCKVRQPDIVAEMGTTDLQSDLDIRLRLDERLIGLQHQFDVEQISTVRTRVTESLGNAYRQRPPAVEGMVISFEGVHVSPPPELRNHCAELRDTNWFRETEKLWEKFEKERVAHIESLLRSPELAEAAAIARTETTAQKAAERAFQERDTRTQRLIEQVQAWSGTDGGKRAPIDRRHLADELFRQLTDTHAPTADPEELTHAATNGHPDQPKDGPVIPSISDLDGS